MSRPCPRLIPPALLLTLATADPAGEFRDLFGGKILDDWIVEGPAADRAGRPMWSVEDGRIVRLGEGFGFLRHDRREFGDFTLSAESGSGPSRAGPAGHSTASRRPADAVAMISTAMTPSR